MQVENVQQYKLKRDPSLVRVLLRIDCRKISFLKSFLKFFGRIVGIITTFDDLGCFPFLFGIANTEDCFVETHKVKLDYSITSQVCWTKLHQ